MNLAFYFPLALLGVMAVSVPLWLHLARRFRGKVVKFSAMRFLHDEPPAGKAPWNLRNPWLLVLRGLALSLLVLAFAWPYDRNRTDTASAESSVYIFDNTLSHQAGGVVAASRRELIQALTSGRAVSGKSAVIELAARPRVLVPLGRDPVEAASAVRSLPPTFERGSFAAAVRLAEVLLQSTEGDRRKLLLFSDQQLNQWAEIRELAPSLNGIRIEALGGQRAPRPNLALARPCLQRFSAGDRSLNELALEVHHFGNATSAGVQVEANGREVLDRQVRLDGKPSDFLLSAQWEDDRMSPLRGVARIRGAPDELAGDNTVYFALPAPRRGTLALLSQSIYLRAAVSPEVMRDGWELRPESEAAEILQAADRGAFPDVLCLESSNFRQSAVARTLLQRFLEAGRGVLLILNEASSEAEDALRGIGIGFHAEPVTLSTPQAIGFLPRDHPIFRSFRSLDFGLLTDVHFQRFVHAASDELTPLLFMEDGQPLLFQLPAPRKLIVAAFAWDRASTDWPLHPTFVPFLDLCLQQLGPEPPAAVYLTPSEESVLRLPLASKALEYVLRNESAELSRGPVREGQVRLTAPSQPGVYSVEFESPDDPAIWLVVNPPPLESDLQYADPQEIRDVTHASAEGHRSSGGSRAREPLAENILRQRIWWILLLLALFAFLGENLWLAVRQYESGN